MKSPASNIVFEAYLEKWRNDFLGFCLEKNKKVPGTQFFSIETPTFHNNNPQILTYVFKCDIR